MSDEEGAEASVADGEQSEQPEEPEESGTESGDAQQKKLSDNIERK